jgi:hypothetical protein
MEGINRAAFLIAHELSQNSRSGLTIRFLSKKLELPQEEIEYLVDINQKLFFTDITKIKLPTEGMTAIKRINDGLENLGDTGALYSKVKSLNSHDFRLLEEQLDIDELGSKKAVAEFIIANHYQQPESIVEYVASRGFSDTARELFDIILQSEEGIMPVSTLRATHGKSEYEVEQAIWELVRGMALFEMFRFDSEERLIRNVGLLSELRQWREENKRGRTNKKTLKGAKDSPGEAYGRELHFTDTLCHLVTAIAAKGARLRGDGDLFKEDLRRLSDTVSEDMDPSLATCLWGAEGVGWLKRIENTLEAPDLEDLVGVNHFERHKLVFNWLMTTGDESRSRKLLGDLLPSIKTDQWYSVETFIESAIQHHSQNEKAVLKQLNGSYQFVNPGTAMNMERTLSRSLEEALFWTGCVEQCSDGIDDYIRFTPIGLSLICNEDASALEERYSKQSRELVVQPNFDIIVPTQDVDPLLTVPLDQFANRQSTGAATVYHLTKDTFTRALQEGHDGDAFIEYLMTHNRGGSLPDNVMRTLEDWRGGLRKIHLKTVQILEVDDSLVMADLQHRRKYNKFLNPVDASLATFYDESQKEELIRQLEKDGFIVEE